MINLGQGDYYKDYLRSFAFFQVPNLLVLEPLAIVTFNKNIFAVRPISGLFISENCNFLKFFFWFFEYYEIFTAIPHFCRCCHVKP